MAPQGEPAICCGKNEINATGYSLCPDYTCQSAINSKNGIHRPCALFILDVNYCRCKPGYYYNNCSVCVELNECNVETKCVSDSSHKSSNCTKPCQLPNTVQRCFNDDCERTCDNLLAGKSDECPTSSTQCSVGCDCKPGYYNDSNGDCVPADQC